MEPRKIRAFLLRLSPSIRDEAEELARQEGISLNHFISLALAERMTRMECSAAASHRQQAAAAAKPATRPVASHNSVSFPLSAASKLSAVPLRLNVEQRRVR